MSVLPQESRPALGQVGDLGAFYDARTESFLPLNLFGSDPSPSPQAITTTSIGSKSASILASDTLEEKFARLGVGSELAGSFLAGMVPVSGSASYLKAARKSERYDERALLLEIKTGEVGLDLHHLRGADGATFNQCPDATHVVTGITFGARVVIAVRRAADEDPNLPGNQLESLLEQLLSYMRTSVVKREDVDDEPNTLRQSFGDSRLAVFWDFRDKQPIQNIGISEAIDLIDNLPSVLAKEDYGRGVNLSYTITPTDSLGQFAGARLCQSLPTARIPDGIIQQFIRVFEQWNRLGRSIQDYIQDSEAISLCFSIKGADAVIVRLKLEAAIKDIIALKSDYRQTFLDVRKSKCPPRALTGILARCYSGEASQKVVMPILSQAKEDLELKMNLLKHGGQYSDFEGASSMISTGSNIYVLFFTQDMKKDRDIWEANRRILYNLLSRRSDYLVVAAECEPDDISFSKSRVLFYRQGDVVVPDMREAQDYADQSFAKYDPKALIQDGCPPPIDRRPVNIACPDTACGNEEREWHCYQCRQPLEYYNKQLYCDCGRTKTTSFTWQCRDHTHGKNFVPYTRSTLASRLKRLESYKYQNILLLGETGVGKSTFINAFYNYMTYRDLDEAMSHEKLEAIIPSSFTMQRIEETPNGRRFVQTDIRVGENDRYEADGTRGDSATQQTGVYRIPIGDTVYRIIDTPGVGDVRGIDADRKNLDNILQTLNRIHNLNGVIILLKPNAARLTLTFRFCIQELLTYLHRDAARNIMWGFTNTRQSNYMPGDSYRPLERLLEQHRALGLTLNPDNVFCFDSESFRCLAAQKQGCVPTENLEDFRRSWQRSTEETHRLLRYVSTLEPHSVTGTICLNRAREIISHLTAPIADVDDMIRRTIDLVDYQLTQVNNATTREAVLQNALHYQRIDVETHPLSRPRTVCKNASCVDFRDVGGLKRPVYRSLCHDPCYLTRVPEEVIEHAELMNCAAFHGSSHCVHADCGHHWQEHMHIRFSQEEKIVQVIDHNVQTELQESQTTLEARRLAVKNLKKQVQEHRDELAEIRQAASQFGVFLKSNSIAAYNDAMIAYLNMQIKEERDLIAFSKSKGNAVPENERRLEGLKKSKDEYQVRIKLLEEKMASSDDAELVDEKTIDDMVAKLYALPHWGGRLQQIREAVEWSRAEDFREQQFRPKVNKDVMASFQQSAKGSGVVNSIQRFGSSVTSAMSNSLFAFTGMFSSRGMTGGNRKRAHKPVRPEGYTTRSTKRRADSRVSEN